MFEVHRIGVFIESVNLWFVFFQRENQILRRGEDMTVKDQISKKNREISSFIDEIRVSSKHLLSGEINFWQINNCHLFVT